MYKKGDDGVPKYVNERARKEGGKRKGESARWMWMNMRIHTLGGGDSYCALQYSTHGTGRDEAKYQEFKRITEELVKETGSLQWKKGH